MRSTMSNLKGSELVVDPTETSSLEEYWDEHRINDLEPQDPSELRLLQRKTRSLSTATAIVADQTLPPGHPALSILKYLDTFGPLVFPLHRAALLRKRILLVRPPPVQLTCNYGECSCSIGKSRADVQKSTTSPSFPPFPSHWPQSLISPRHPSLDCDHYSLLEFMIFHFFKSCQRMYQRRTVIHLPQMKQIRK